MWSVIRSRIVIDREFASSVVVPIDDHAGQNRAERRFVIRIEFAAGAVSVVGMGARIASVLTAGVAGSARFVAGRKVAEVAHEHAAWLDTMTAKGSFARKSRFAHPAFAAWCFRRIFAKRTLLRRNRRSIRKAVDIVNDLFRLATLVVPLLPPNRLPIRSNRGVSISPTVSRRGRFQKNPFFRSRRRTKRSGVRLRTNRLDRLRLNMSNKRSTDHEE